MRNSGEMTIEKIHPTLFHNFAAYSPPLISNHLNFNPSKLIFLEYLVNNKIDRNEEREQVCSLLLKSGRFQEINSTRLQQLVAKANFHSIYFDLAIQNKDYKECLIEF